MNAQFIIACLTGLLLSGCRSDLNVDLGGGYNLSSIDGHSIAVRRILGNSQASVSIISETVVNVYWNDSLIVAKQAPSVVRSRLDLNDDNVSYFIARKVWSEDQNPHRLVYGPFSQDELTQELSDRNLSLQRDFNAYSASIK